MVRSDLATSGLLLVALTACTPESPPPTDDTIEDTGVVSGDTDDTDVRPPSWTPSAPPCPAGSLRLGMTPDDVHWSMRESDHLAEFGATFDLGDVDGDGATDVVIGAPGDEAATTRDGTVHLVRGPLLKVSGSLDGDSRAVRGRVDGGNFGASVALVDLDGVGVPSVAVSGEALDREERPAGPMSLLPVAAFDDPQAEFTASGPAALADVWLGEAVRLRRPTGVDILAVGAPGLRPPGAPTWSADGGLVLLGPDLTLLGTWMAPPGARRAGGEVVPLDDVDGDGINDVAIASQYGQVWVLSVGAILGGPPPTVLLHLTPPDWAMDSVRLEAGDLDGDGHLDLILYRREMYPGAPRLGHTGALVDTGDTDSGDTDSGVLDSAVWADTGGSDSGGSWTAPPIREGVWMYTGLAPSSDDWTTDRATTAWLAADVSVDPVGAPIGVSDLDGDGRDELLLYRWPDVLWVANPLTADPAVAPVLVTLPGPPSEGRVNELTGDDRPDLIVSFPWANAGESPTLITPGAMRAWELCPVTQAPSSAAATSPR